MSRYSLYYNEAVAGQIYQAEPRDIISLQAYVDVPIANYPGGPISFGCPVAYSISTNPVREGVAIINDTEPTDFIGISVLSHIREVEGSNISETLYFGAAYFDKDVVSVLTKGKIWVKIVSGANVEMGEKAYAFNRSGLDGYAFTEFTNAAFSLSNTIPQVRVNNIEIGLFVTNKNAQNLAVLQFDLSANKVIL
jgi:hypothetical protein